MTSKTSKINCVVCNNPVGQFSIQVGDKYYCIEHGEEAAYQAYKEGSGKSKWALELALMYKKLKEDKN